LGANDKTAEFQLFMLRQKLGKAGLDPDITKMKDISTLFEEIIKYVPIPQVDLNKPLQMLVTSINRR